MDTALPVARTASKPEPRIRTGVAAQPVTGTTLETMGVRTNAALYSYAAVSVAVADSDDATWRRRCFERATRSRSCCGAMRASTRAETLDVTTSAAHDGCSITVGPRFTVTRTSTAAAVEPASAYAGVRTTTSVGEPESTTAGWPPNVTEMNAGSE
jgi:hypothetical protein